MIIPAHTKYKRTFCSSRANKIPWHTFNEHKSTAARRCHCSVFGQHIRVRLRLILHRMNINNMHFRSQAHTNTNVPTFRPGANTTPCHAFNEHKCTTTATEIDIAVYLNSTSGWDYDLMHTVSNMNNNFKLKHTYTKNTNAHPVRPGPLRRRCIHSTSIIIAGGVSSSTL